MKSIVHLRILALSAALIAAAGCAPTPPPGRVYVVEGPPPVREEVIPGEPGPTYIWVPGYWSRAPRGYVWVAGRYEVPPRARRAYVPGQRRHARGGWYFVEGHWR
ncbi:MAG TPA: hypothetical protein VIG08_13370 [Gemmatimonadales bacterium]|jgi:hypothetical protein